MSTLADKPSAQEAGGPVDDSDDHKHVEHDKGDLIEQAGTEAFDDDHANSPCTDEPQDRRRARRALETVKGERDEIPEVSGAGSRSGSRGRRQPRSLVHPRPVCDQCSPIASE